jgi:hypothetical protein
MTREEMRDRIRGTLNKSEYWCARCQHCDRQLDDLADALWPEVERLRKYVSDARDRLASARQFRESERDYQRLMERVERAKADVEIFKRRAEHATTVKERISNRLGAAYVYALRLQQRPTVAAAQRELAELIAALEAVTGEKEESSSSSGGGAIALLRTALHLRLHGEHAPGGAENWADWDLEAERFLRGIDDGQRP